MLHRIADRVAGLVALTAIGLSLWVALTSGRTLSWAMLLLAVVMLAVGAWWLGQRAPGSPFREMALPAAVATVMPIFLVSAADQSPAVAFWVLTALAAATVGIQLADTLPDRHRLPVTLATAGLASIAAALGMLRAVSYEASLITVLSLAGTTALPGVVAGVIRHTTPSIDGTRTTVVSALELGVVGLTPAIAVLTMVSAGGSPWGAVPLLAWIVVVLAAQYFAVGPLARNVSIATTQRDIVVAAMEAERSRIAADIHDDALQELTLLGWRLDAAGDTEGAARAREVADRLRAICGDLRLPILDDLGTGPALEWLVERIERLAGGEVRLERGDQVRPPAEVELAFFRVAQEALSNAVRHGRPPIVVRYWTSQSGASLSIDDSGSGVNPARAAASHEEGHFGLLNMRQRAEQIGALLDVRSRPAGGTQVALEWRTP